MADDENAAGELLLLRLEQVLANDKSGEQRAQLVGQLTNLRDTMADGLRKGAPPAEYQRMEKLKAAAEAAIGLVETMPWHAS